MIYQNEKTKYISFPLGGIGSGCIGLAGNGELIDWEIFNRPNKDTRNGYSHFAIKATRGGKTTAMVLHGDTNERLVGRTYREENYMGYGYGPSVDSLAGFPHFKNVKFDGTFPTAKLTFTDDRFPATVALNAFNPFIPHDEYNSSIPAAFFEWEIENTEDEAIEFALSFTVQNPSAVSKNSRISDGNANGIFFISDGKADSETDYCDLCILTDNADTTVQEYWYRGKMKDAPTMYWNNFTKLARMPERIYVEPGNKDHGTVTSYVTVAPHESAKLRFVVSWNVPTAYNYWWQRKEGPTTWRNYYATQFANSEASAKYALANFDELYEKTKLFASSLQSCTLSEHVIDAISANLSVLKSPTSLRLEDGSFWGFEGCNSTDGSCYGSCQHVWNYAYAMPYLFPRLERSLRENTIKYALVDSGASGFRINLPLPEKAVMDTARPCLDGQMGEVIKCYREWKISGDDEWLRANSDSIFKMLEFAWSKENVDRWDANMDGVLEGRQHHTLDVECFGPSSWLQGFYLLALDCGAKMAQYLGENKRAELYTELYNKGKAWTNENLFNGKYFMHKVDLCDKSVTDSFEGTEHYWNEEAKEIKYQVADGCIIDQMLADWHAVLLGSAPVFDSDKKKVALKNLYNNNFKESMRDVANMWRNFSLNDEAGVLICSYPEGANKPAIPIPYCEETMTGFEYSLAGLLIAEGYITEGERIVKSIRDKYNGSNRNPWNEIECGSNYARSMASFALLPIYSGFTFDMSKKHIGFAPINKTGKYLFSVAESWGNAEFSDSSIVLNILGNALELNAISVPNAEHITEVTVDGKKLDFTLSNGKIMLGGVTIAKELRLA